MSTTSIRIKKEQHQTLSAIAKRRGMTITALLYRILAQYFGGGSTPQTDRERLEVAYKEFKR